MSETIVGEIRPSQLLWTYGPGALIDLPNLSVVTLGSDLWERDRCAPVQEPRLLAGVRRILGPQVEDIRLPPISEADYSDQYSAEARVGVPVRPFPRWLRCVQCGLLSPYDAQLFDLKEDRYRRERTRFVHRGCRGSDGTKKARDADAVPARFLLACRGGHLDDFPWHWFVHGGASSCKGILRFFESGASLQTENLWVKCEGCGATKSLAQAFGKAGKRNLPACRGRHPHLNRFEDDCNEEPRTILLGATNGWFPVALSVLSLPEGKTPLADLVAKNWKPLERIKSEDGVEAVVETLREYGQLQGIEAYSTSEIWAAIEARRTGEAQPDEIDVKAPEWGMLSSDPLPADTADFRAKKVPAPSGLPMISRVVLLERLREVNALLGFSRVESPDKGTPTDCVPRAPLTRGAPRWLPASQVHGEGVFIQFDEEALSEWEARPVVQALADRLKKGHRGWRTKRRLTPAEEGFPGARYVLLHTLAHVLIREFALECGYSAASIRERVYGEEGTGQAGILVYTAAADSDGTLGGLVDLGRPEQLGPLVVRALDRARFCASDPLCSEHDPSADQSLHGAACHACSFVAETSCERGNRHLDRAFLVETLESVDAAFFRS